MTSSPFEEQQRAEARAKYEAGELRAALHLWDTLKFPERLSNGEVVMFEAARRTVAESG